MTALPVTRKVSESWDWPMQYTDGVAKVTNTNNHFEVGLDVQFFNPKEVEVKTSGRELFVHCRHEEKKTKSGTVFREVNRTYTLPDDINLSTLKTQLTKQGVLLITAEKN